MQHFRKKYGNITFRNEVVGFACILIHHFPTKFFIAHLSEVLLARVPAIVSFPFAETSVCKMESENLKNKKNKLKSYKKSHGILYTIVYRL